LAEQRTENPRVGSSILPLATFNADIAGNDSVERCLACEAESVGTIKWFNFRC
jgi:hypothetical protein